MALIGNCTHYKYENSGTTEEKEVTQPDGRVETIEQPIFNQIETSYEDIYLIITKIDSQHHYRTFEDGSVEKNVIVFVDFGGYESQDARNKNHLEPLFAATTQIQNYNFDENIYSQGYDAIKTVEGMGNLVND